MEYNDPIVVKLVYDSIRDVDRKVSPRSETGSIVGGTTKLLGAFSIAHELLSIIKQSVANILNPIKNMLLGIGKLLAQLLRPIADVIIIMLMPILVFLKPIIKVFNDIMRPFKTAAFKLMGEAGRIQKENPMAAMALNSLAVSTIFAGFTSAIIGVIGELLKGLVNVLIELIKVLVFNPLIELFRPILELFGVNVDQLKQTVFKSLDNARDGINKAIDVGVKFVTDQSKQFVKDGASSVTKIFPEIDTKTPSNVLKIKLQQAIDNAFAIKIPQVSTPDSSVSSGYQIPKTIPNYVATNYDPHQTIIVKSNGGSVKR
jgi:hypothetical protein